MIILSTLDGSYTTTHPRTIYLQKKTEMLRNYSKESQIDRTEYNESKQQLKKCIKDTKGSFLRKALSARQPKVVWKTVNQILKKQHKRIKHDPSALNQHFCTLASRLTNKENAGTANTAFIESLPANDNHNSFKIQHTDYYEVRKILLNLKNDCSTGYDNIPVKYLKPVDKMVFPNAWKVARICPVPKVENPNEIIDYRPISVLPVLSKVYERVILNQLCDFIDNQSLINDTQSGYRKGHSTTTILMKFRDDIQKAMNKSEITLAVLIDYSKAFDTVHHETLLQKLHEMNFTKESLMIIHDYLCDRKQFVQVDDNKSNTLPVHFGVPQGSILGPVLFNLYVMDLSQNVNSNCTQYADDTILYQHCKVKKLTTCAKSLENDLQQLSDWSNQQNFLFNDLLFN